MAEANDGANLDLAQILQTLANLQAMPNIVEQDQPQPYDPSRMLPAQSASIPEHGGAIPALASYGQDQTHRQPPPGPPQSRTMTPSIDPSTIIEWKHGLRCVNKIASHNPHFEATIQKLIKDQERNVTDWAAGRDRLNEEQAAKRENEQKYRAAVSLPGVLDGTAPLRTPEREQQEHDQYIQKVYRASRQMVASHSTTLKGLGVPFFGVNPELVVTDGTEPSERIDGKISKNQVLELQRKMLNHLMEMYGD
ncbi:hypothetical protein K505DRAFT_319104 [Melanomma pulvis-pyrius CBS 109.77]|uniref:Uncharacterized protein n=1 Tax=Melanomma pulvis-pyrius CBS 109.77 TaxID=1314802 RepID=A0A6A6WQ96_9PLEO|nr:hypothetical protein K505DRAFT_319104 [Melanomma pulvis-pyrius CBS 109.77]